MRIHIKKEVITKSPERGQIYLFLQIEAYKFEGVSQITPARELWVFEPRLTIPLLSLKSEGAELKSRSLMLNSFELFVQLVALFESLHSSGGINHFSFAGEERMAFTA